MTVYFAQREDGAIKIGAAGSSKADAERRIAQYVRTRGTQLACVPGYLFVERWFHARHQDDRLEGEWFSPRTKLLNDIELIRWDAFPGLPAEPLPCRLSGEFWQQVRTQVFRLEQQDMASLLRLSHTTYAQGEASGSTHTRAAALDAAAERLDIAFRWATHVALPPYEAGDWNVKPSVRGVPGEPRGLPHSWRYRTHAVRSIGEGARL